MKRIYKFIDNWLYPFLLMIFAMSMVFTIFKWYAYVFNYEKWIRKSWTHLYPFRAILMFYSTFLVFFGIPIIVYMLLITYLVYKQHIPILSKWIITLTIPLILFIYPGFQIKLWIDDIGSSRNIEFLVALEGAAIFYFMYFLKNSKLKETRE